MPQIDNTTWHMGIVAVQAWIEKRVKDTIIIFKIIAILPLEVYLDAA